eukprot:3647203-Ditylum_brightwellii.AAC.1
MIGWFQNSHPKFTCRDDAAYKLGIRLDTDKKLDLHVHNVKFSTVKQKYSTKALMLTCNREKASKIKNMLYKMNVDNCKEKQRWSQTGT